MALSGQPSDFAHLRVHDEQPVRLGLAERYFVEDPNTCLLKLRHSAASAMAL